MDSSSLGRTPLLRPPLLGLLSLPWPRLGPLSLSLSVPAACPDPCPDPCTGPPSLSLSSPLLLALLPRPGARRNAEVALVITHPYGPLGGNMDNNVVQAVYDAAEKAGFAAVCFNFR